MLADNQKEAETLTEKAEDVSNAVKEKTEEVQKKAEDVKNAAQDVAEDIKNIPAIHEAEANKIIQKHAFLATAGGLIPVPGIDVAAVTTAQVFMVQSLARLFNVPFEEEKTKTIASSAVTTLLSRMASIGVQRFLDPFSGFGSVSDELTNAAVAGFSTAAAGEVYKLHFQNGGTIATLEFGNFWDYFHNKVTNGDINHKTFSGFNSAFSYLTQPPR